MQICKGTWLLCGHCLCDPASWSYSSGRAAAPTPAMPGNLKQIASAQRECTKVSLHSDTCFSFSVTCSPPVAGLCWKRSSDLSFSNSRGFHMRLRRYPEVHHPLQNHKHGALYWAIRMKPGLKTRLL